MGQIVIAENVTKKFGSVRAVDSVSFTINRGEIVGLLGPNGAGKTTLMRMITGFFPPNSGTIRVNGTDIFENPYAAKKNIGYLPESLPLYNEMSVTAYLEFVAAIKEIPYEEKYERIYETIKSTGLEEVSRKPAGRLSRGFKQRVALAQALISDPDLLVLDEPTRGLDPKQIVETRELIKRLAGERTVLLSSHILPEVSMICQKVMIIDHGKIITVDGIDELMKKFSTDRLEDVFMRLTTRETHE